METAGTKMAKRAFNKMHGNGRTMSPGVKTKGKNMTQPASKATGHRATSITMGRGNRKAAQKTRMQTAGFRTGHKAPNATNGRGKRMHPKTIGPKNSA